MTTSTVPFGYFDIAKYEFRRWDEPFSIVDTHGENRTYRLTLRHIEYHFPVNVTISRRDLDVMLVEGRLKDFKLEPGFGIHDVSEILTITVEI